MDLQNESMDLQNEFTFLRISYTIPASLILTHLKLTKIKFNYSAITSLRTPWQIRILPLNLINVKLRANGLNMFIWSELQSKLLKS